ncbi:MAG: N-acetylmuramoyl-L-alanine amidase [Clostridia bacterium]|nr:N-acetylmuramoyl-L-alanine amidase [Clostridia bacterium]
MKGFLLSIVALILTVSLLLLAALFLPALLRKSQAEAVAGALAPTVILDAGHGGRDGGATARDGTPEKELNLDVTLKLAALLRAAGYHVVLTRDADYALGEGAPVGKRKQADLAGRLALMKAQENALFISIHMNTYPGESCRGTQIWYAPAYETAKTLAADLQTAVKAHLQPENHRKVKAATSAIYLLHRATCPAILIECGFLTNPQESALLCTPDYRMALALVIFEAAAKNFQAGTCRN